MIMEYLPLQVVKRGIFLIKNKGIFQKLLHINSVRGKVFCCRMAWWKQKDIFAVENLYTVDGRGIFSVQGEYPYIYVMTVQKIPGSVEAAGDKNGFQPRIKKEEFRENLLNQQIPHFDINENPICDRDIPAQFFYAVQGFLLHIKYPSGCSEKDLPLSGGNQLTALFFKQRCSQLALQFFNVLCQSRLEDKAASGCLGNVFILCYGQQIFIDSGIHLLSP